MKITLFYHRGLSSPVSILKHRTFPVNKWFQQVILDMRSPFPLISYTLDTCCRLLSCMGSPDEQNVCSICMTSSRTYFMFMGKTALQDTHFGRLFSKCMQFVLWDFCILTYRFRPNSRILIWDVESFYVSGILFMLVESSTLNIHSVKLNFFKYTCISILSSKMQGLFYLLPHI